MSNLLDAGAGEQKPQPINFHACHSCGGATFAMSILDSREGKTYSLRRCLSCEKLTWYEDK
ncbi:hypothetical protein [Bradyrhizobium sp. C9]|uniref:hypothetical protein n=1 Tax=Bradyrhizobium sp. C9 TaxID=142585 RepID=UPI001177FD0F|nr:hypothetical protein [Bradyrhizobium sp. C9]